MYNNVRTPESAQLTRNKLIISPDHKYIQSTLVISKSKAPSETLRNIRTSTYQICRVEENTNQISKFHKRTCNLTPLVRMYIKNIVEKGRNCSSGAISLLIHYILLPGVMFPC